MSRAPRSAWVALLLLGCAKQAPLPQVKAELDAGFTALRVDDWAMQCAPRETGEAEAHYAFAQIEHRQGDERRAEHHYDLARAALTEALRKADLCRPKDRDADGIEDHLDACPDAAETVNGYKDDDGCPEVDTDQDTVFDDADRCPSEKEDLDQFEDDDGCPDRDNDRDGLIDSVDACPNEPEDMNGYMDTDGCPEGNADRDRDGVPDFVDKCPDEPENINEYLDSDGCPDVKPNDIRVTADRIEIDKRINFATGKAIILRDSYGILDSVAQVLRDYPAIVVRIEGHTDSQGSDAANLKLSDARAESVFNYLVKNGGIAASRLKPVGYGEAKPIDTNNTNAGRANNRRVEFHIVEGSTK